MTTKTWLGAVLLFFAWGFTMHATGLLLHEFGGHALAGYVFGCGIDRFKLTFFGHGHVHYAPCTRWVAATVFVAEWAGLALTIAAGIGAALALRRRDLSPMPRLLLALVAFFFLTGQLGYWTAGGFHDLYDPGHAARWLGAHGVHVVAWLPALLAYAAAAFYCARVAVEAFRAHFGSRSRGQALVQLVTTLGVAGVLYFAAYRIEWALRTDMTMRGVAFEAERVAIAENAPRPFPIELVLTATAVVAIVSALARPIATAPRQPSPVSRRVVALVLAATGACFITLATLVIWGGQAP